MALLTSSRWLFTAVLATGLGVAAMAPMPARASDDLVRVLVNVADVIYHGGQPYYRHGDRSRYDRVVIVRDRYQRPSYYRYVPRDNRVAYRPGPPPHARAHGYYRDPPRYYGRQDRDRWNDDRRNGHGKKTRRNHHD